jgi:hypothetical protein
MKTKTCVLNNAVAMLAVALLSGCAVNMKVPVKDPAPSADTSYNKTAAATPVSLAFKDDQSEDDKARLLTGLIPMQMVYQDKPFEAVPWIARHTVAEMAARGLPVTLAANSVSNPNVLIKRIHIENHRVSGFSPFVTFTSLRADVVTAKGPQRVTAYIKRGKVPVWSFDEIADPTYNDPLNIITKELAAKLNQQLFGQVVADDKVNALIAKIKRSPETEANAYVDVYQLGFSNNPIAIPELVKFASHNSEYVRQAAISSLGILKAEGQTDFLINLYESSGGLWQDRAMALKALGDIGTPRTLDYLKAQLKKFENRTDKDALWTKEIILMYI